MEQEQTKPSTPEEAAQEFMVAYEELCRRLGVQFRPTVTTRLRDDGTYSLVPGMSVVRLGE